MRTVAALAAVTVVDVAVALRAQRREWQRLLKPLPLPVGVVVVREPRDATIWEFNTHGYSGINRYPTCGSESPGG